MFNPFFTEQPVEIRDTVPAYLFYTNIASPLPVSVSSTGATPNRKVIHWLIPSARSKDTTYIIFRVKPQDGVCASQPMFVNRAWVTMNGVSGPTNSTYHQGAGISVITFSSAFGGQIYNAGQQALDYGASPRSGVIVVPDKGYRFAGWSHAAYRSLRGKTIEAQNNIMSYDTLTVYGDVALRANFETELYPIVYHLHGGANSDHNPSIYTIENDAITLGAPEKAGDRFIGWTGSNGDAPQPAVTIPQGSTGELEFYANYLYSGKQENNNTQQNDETDRIWAAEDVLFIITSRDENLVRIYSPDGLLLKQQSIPHRGETKIKLPQGLYIVTLNNKQGKKVMIND